MALTAKPARPVKPKVKTELKSPEHICPRCSKVRPIHATRRTCGPCFREIEKGGDRRIAEGLTPAGFWELDAEHRRLMWKVWVRVIVDQLLAPTVATLMCVEIHALKEWHVAGANSPPERLVGPVLETVGYLSALERQRQPEGLDTRPADIRSVTVDLVAVGRFFGVVMKVTTLFAPPVES